VTHRLLTLCAAAVAALTLAACTSSGTPGKGTTAPAGIATTSDTSTPTDSTSTDPSTPTATTSTSSSATPTTSATHASDECTFAQLSMRAVRGSGAAQREFASILFTNKSGTRCTMYGFPGISLRASGALLGQPASRDTSTPPANVHLAPGAQAHADITDNSSCQAALSDTVRVYPPDSTQFADLPLVLRGCALTVKPVTTP